MKQIQIQLIHTNDGKVNAPAHILRSALSLLSAFDTKLHLLAIHRLQIIPNPFHPKNEKERLTAPEFLVMVLDGGIKMMYWDMHICTIPMLMLKADEIFIFPGQDSVDLSRDKDLIDMLQKM